MTIELLEKFDKGEEPITNEELESLYKFYKKLVEDTKLLGPVFNLMWVELLTRMHRCERYMEARGMNIDLPF